MGIGAAAPVLAVPTAAPQVDDLLAAQRDASRRGFFVGMSLAANAGDRAAVAASFLRNASTFGADALAEPANAALIAWARDAVAAGGDRLLDYLA